MVINTYGSSSKGALGFGGVHDWIVQRRTAILMGIYFIYLFGFFAYNNPLTYTAWVSLFQPVVFKILTIVMLIAICRHTWIGLWTIATDYIHGFKTKTLFLLACKMLLLAYLISGVLIIWPI